MGSRSDYTTLVNLVKYGKEWAFLMIKKFNSRRDTLLSTPEGSFEQISYGCFLR